MRSIPTLVHSHTINLDTVQNKLETLTHQENNNNNNDLPFDSLARKERKSMIVLLFCE